MRNRIQRAALVIFSTMLVAVSFAKPKNNPLDRMTPVPDNEPIPVIDFFRPRLFVNPKLNPSGTHFAAMLSSGDDRQDLVTMELATGKIVRLTGGGEYDIAEFEWLNDQRLLFSIIQEKLYSVGLFTVTLGQLSDAYPLQRYNVVVTIGFPQKHPDEVIIWIKHSAKDDGADGGIYRINTAKNWSGVMQKPLAYSGDDGLRASILRSYPTPKGGDVVNYVADRNGELAFALTAKDGVFTLHRYVDDNWIKCPVNLDKTPLAAAGEKPGEIIVLGPKTGEQPRGLHLMDAATGALGELIARDSKYDLQDIRLYRHSVDGRILGIQYHQMMPDAMWFDPRYQTVQEALAKTFPDSKVTILGSDRNENQFFVSTFSDVNPGKYHLVKLGTNPVQIQAVASQAPWIDSKRMQPMRKLTYKARDGREIEGLVTLPADASKEHPVPLVVLPHGGPWANDCWTWDPEVQFLASRGYAVFQPNYRGSTGTTWKFPDNDMWAFRKMHDDVTDGVKQLLKTRMIDPDRIAIMGSSFGGYLALCGAAYEPALYRCAITIAGVFDWERVIKENRNNEYRRSAYGVLRRNLGDPQKNSEQFAAISPLKSVNCIKVPVFVAHGGEDVVANVAESKKLIAELKKFNVPFEKQIERDEGHGFRNLENEVELYTAIEAFLKKNLSPRPKD